MVTKKERLIVKKAMAYDLIALLEAQPELSPEAGEIFRRMIHDYIDKEESGIEKKHS